MTVAGARRAVTVQTEDGRVVCAHCLVADRPFTRMKGLLGRRCLEDGEGLVIRPTFSIQTWFMRFPIDAVFLDQDFVVVDVVPELAAWRTATRRTARSVLELRAGECEKIRLKPGDRLRIVEHAES